MAVILMVEDEVFTRQIAEMMIQDWGHDTLSASDADEALSFLRSARHIDALFTDIYLKDSVLGGCALVHQPKLSPEGLLRSPARASAILSGSANWYCLL
jgi:CheY-like chemotaxis protein